MIQAVKSGVLALVIALNLAGCGRLTEDYKFVRGIGTGLYSQDLGKQTRLLDTYFTHICIQAGLSRRAGPEQAEACDYSLFTAEPNYWNNFVAQGLNDVDRRCDAYLSWLDTKRRSRDFKIKQTSSIGAATLAIMGITQTGAAPLSIVGVAFGLLVDSIANYHSRLLLEIEGSTVQAIVFRERARLREEIRAIDFTNKPDTYHAIRSYLNVCLPHTIETEINTTLTIDKRTGSTPTAPLVDIGTMSTRSGPLGGDAKVDTPPGGRRAPAESWIGKSDVRIGAETARAIQGALCFKGGAVDGEYGPKTETALKLLESISSTRTMRETNWRGRSVHLNQTEVNTLRSLRACKGGGKNYLENLLLNEPQQAGLKSLIEQKIQTKFNKTGTPGFPQMRAEIDQWREDLNLDDGPDGMFSGQLTPDFIRLIF